MPATPQPMDIYHPDAATPRPRPDAFPRPAPKFNHLAALEEQAARPKPMHALGKIEKCRAAGRLGGRPRAQDAYAESAPRMFREYMAAAGRPVFRHELITHVGCSAGTAERLMRHMRADGEIEYDPSTRGWTLTQRDGVA